MSNCYMGLDQQYDIPIAVINDAENVTEDEPEADERRKVTSVTLPQETLLQAFKEGPEKARYYE